MSLRLPRPFNLSPTCERGLAVFLIVWGTVLLLDAAFPQARRGIFYGRFMSLMPGEAWAAIMLLLGIGKIIAYKRASNRWRVKLSALTVALFAAIASIAVYALMPAVAPLASFVAIAAWWCHVNLIKQIALETAIVEIATAGEHR